MSVPRLIAILEDNVDRTAAMIAALTGRLSQFEHVITNDPGELIHILKTRMDDIVLVSLDHDLHERPDQSTTLTGMMVVDFLVTLPPRVPVVLHTSNVRDGETMKSRLREQGWSVTWVTPFLDTEWIGADWLPVVRKAIQRASRAEGNAKADDGN